MLISLFILSGNPASATSSAGVEMLSNSGYLDLIGYHVVGEVQNLGNLDVHLVEVTASFYSVDGVIIANSTSPTSINVVPAGRKAPFEIVLFNPAQSAAVDHYSLQLRSTAYQGLFPLGLKILSNSSYVESTGWMHITGTIRNEASGKASSVKMVSTYYDLTVNVIATAFSPSNPNDIGPGQQATFDAVLSPDRSPYVKSYTLTSESAGYGLLSNFPFHSILSVSAPSTTSGTATTLRAVLRDENRDPITNANVLFSIYTSGAWKEIGPSVTDQAGEGKLSYLATTAGNFQVRATFGGDRLHSSASDEVELTVKEGSSNVPPNITSPAALLPLAVIFPFGAGLLGLGYIIVRFLRSRRYGTRNQPRIEITAAFEKGRSMVGS